MSGTDTTRVRPEAEAAGYRAVLPGELLEAHETWRQWIMVRAEEALVAARDALTEARARVEASGVQPGVRWRDIEEPLDDLAETIEEIHPSTMDHLGVGPALRRWLARWEARNGIEVSFEVQAAPLELPHRVETAAFRIVEEAVLNAGRHAGASRVRVTLQRAPGTLECTVEDDGSGFDLPRTLEGASRDTKLGLVLMQVWADRVGGRLEIDTAPERGTRVRAVLPLY